MTGLGLLGFGTGRLLSLYRIGALRLIASMLRKPSSYLLVENPDDLALLRARGANPGPRFAILGGAGVDPQAFAAQPQPSNEVPVAAFVGRMIRSKGVDVLIRAHARLKSRGVPIQVELYGGADDGNAEAIGEDVLKSWCVQPDVRWLGQVADVGEIWRRADIFGCRRAAARACRAPCSRRQRARGPWSSRTCQDAATSSATAWKASWYRRRMPKRWPMHWSCWRVTATCACAWAKPPGCG